MAPWILFSALGFAVLLEWTSRMVVLGAAAVGLICLGAIFNGARFVRYYFRDFPTLAAPYFQYGIEQTLRAVDELDNHTGPIVITGKLFFFFFFCSLLVQLRVLLHRRVHR